MTHIEIVRTDADQPWHVRLRALNGEVTWTTETYTRSVAALEAVLLLGRTFSPVGLARLEWIDPPPDGLPTGLFTVWFDSDEVGAKVVLPVRYVDERAEQDG